MIEVAKKVTRWTPQELLAALGRAAAPLGLPPESIAILAAQATLETGRGGTGCYNFNISNIMGAGPDGSYHVLTKAPECASPDKVPAGATVLSSTNVVCGPGKVAYLPPGGSKFRAYKSLDEGCDDKIKVLGRTWPAAVSALGRKADLPQMVRAFVDGLLSPRYFSADPPSYRESTLSIAREYLPLAKHLSSASTAPMPICEQGVIEPGDVTAYQKKLLSLGYDLGPAGADGIAGARTIAAVRAFQKRANLTIDGIVGPKTLAALSTACP